MYGWTGVWLGGCVRVDEYMGVWVYGCVGVWVYGWIGVWVDRCVGGQECGWVDECEWMSM